MPLLFFLFISAPCFARLYIDYTQSPIVQRPLSNASVLVTPAASAQAEAAGYPPRDIAVQVLPALLPSHDVQRLVSALLAASKKGRYNAALDLQNLPLAVKENLKKNALEAAKSARIKNLLFLESPPLSSPGNTPQQDASRFFGLLLNLFEGGDAFIDAGLINKGHNAEVLEVMIHPKQKGSLYSWEQGQAFIFPDAAFVYNSSTMGIFSIPKSLFSRKGQFSTKSRSGSMVLWQEGDNYKMFVLPNSSAFWRMK